MWKDILNFLKSKTVLTAGILAVIIAVLCAFLYMNSIIKGLRQNVDIYRNNEKALIYENDSLKNKAIVYQISLDQLSYFNDSISLKLQEAVKELGIQRKNVKQLQYILNKTRTDTLVMVHRDTIFNPNVSIDTTLTDGHWYSVALGLHYPSTVEVVPEFTNEFTIVTSSRRECVNSPKKFFLWRWFQRKHIVLETTVNDNNPYSNVTESRFINILE
jgi:hypothetical protein